MKKKFTINDNDREQFVDNEEGWYLAQRRSRLSMRAFVSKYRDEIDRALYTYAGEPLPDRLKQGD